ncbi:MAG: ABC transporter [Rhodospirillaceae bacterium]|nr:ABC transporter [Rhodospirillaceae bacterium]
MSEPIVQVCGLNKKFGSVLAVKNISFTLASGETIGLLGGNGAGKSTTLAMLLGLLLPTSGDIFVLGYNMLQNRYKALPHMNFSSPYVDLPHRLTVRENLKIYGCLYGVQKINERIVDLSQDFGLNQFLDRPSGKLSAGQKTRVALAKALLNEPKLLLLDEPTASMDPDTADVIRQHLIRYQRDTDATIILASHNMTEIEELCQNVLIMKKGEIVAQGSPANLVAKFRRKNLEQVFIDIARHHEPMRQKNEDAG